jgi:serine/threonine protein kinase
MAERNVLLRNVTHPFLVGLHYSFQTSTKLYFVLDYVNGGELFFHLQRERIFEEPRARFYAAEITSALGYLHDMNIVYRDLKPENILIDKDGHIILTDFGLCKENVKYGDTTSTFCGTPEYLAPEVLRKQDYGRPVDWWCLGVVTYEMMYGLPPFYSRDVAEMYDGILHKPLRLRPTVTPAARSLLEGLLQKDKNHRLGSGSRDYRDIMDHAFFSHINWDNLYHKKIEPPYHPNVSGDLDLRHFDPEFTREAISDVPSPPHNSSGMHVSVQDETFAGFSYIPTDGTNNFQ